MIIVFYFVLIFIFNFLILQFMTFEMSTLQKSLRKLCFDYFPRLYVL